MHLQFHHDGYRPGSPADRGSSGPLGRTSSRRLPDKVDVLIVGAGPAGLVLAAQLSQFEDISVAVVEQKVERLKVGQADGIQCRSIEIFQAFGFAERVLREAYWVNETVFWSPSASIDRGIIRSGRIRDVEAGLSEFPHVILNQARIHDFWLDIMAKGAQPAEPYYSYALVDLKVDEQSRRDKDSYPVSATFRTAREDQAQTLDDSQRVSAKYVVGCDGARSQTRSMLGLSLTGDAAHQAWGVMDVLCRTNFPDIRYKVVIHSADCGNLLIIPREGGYLVRMYIELDKLGEDERVRSKVLSSEHLIQTAKQIFKPYDLDVAEVVWWSVYEIAQRLCDRFDDAGPSEPQGESARPRVFIAGDACHTHSPKAGQGMNVSMQDAFNLGWKLASVLRGLSVPDILRTYSQERHAVAKELIDFDRELAKMFSAQAKTQSTTQATDPADGGVDPAVFQARFTKAGRYTAGLGYKYSTSILTPDTSTAMQSLAGGFPVGQRFHSYHVVRLCDAKPVQLGHTLLANGNWRLLLFADRNVPIDSEQSKLVRACDSLWTCAKLLLRPPDGGGLPPIESIAVLQQSHTDIYDVMAFEQLPALLRPHRGHHHLTNTHNVFCDEQGQYNIWGSTTRSEWRSIYDTRSISRDGAIVVVRPDGYVSLVASLDDAGCAAIAEFFGKFLTGTE